MYRKGIAYDRETRDYAMYLDEELVGFANTYHEAEVTLDALVFELMTDGLPPETPIDIPDEEPPLTEGDPAPPPELRACLSCGDLTTHPHFCQACREAAEDRYILHQS